MSTLTSTVGRTLRLTSPCDLAAVRAAGGMVRNFLEQQGLTSPELDAWELVLAEAGNNAVEHTSPAALSLPIEFAVEAGVSQVEVRVTDHTPGFEFPDDPKLPDSFSEGGRGLFLIRELTDRIQYLRSKQGNCLVLQRNRTTEGRGDELNPLAAAELERTLQSMTEELAGSYESLAAIFRFTAEMNRESVGREFAERWLRELLTITGADWFALRLVSRDQKRLELELASRPDLPLEPLALGATAGHAAEVAAVTGRQDVWFDLQNPLGEGDPLKRFGSSVAGVIHPVFVNSELVGVLGVGRYAREQSFNAGQVNIIHTFADFLGIQIRNNRIQESYLESRLLRRELEIAANIQRSLLPAKLPELPGLGRAGFSESASKVGGDFYDVIPTDVGDVLLVIADVMGKGVPAAMFAAIFRSHIRARPDLWRQPGRFMAWLNQVLFSDLDRVEMFVTAQIAFLDAKAKSVCVASAGHCPLLLAGRDGNVHEFAPDGPPLGIHARVDFEEKAAPIPPGMLLAMFTDGVIEARDPAGRFLGLEAVGRWISHAAREAAGAEEARNSLSRLVRFTQGGAAATDDVTFLIAAERAAAPA